MEFYPIVEGFEKKVRNGIVIGYEDKVDATFEEYCEWKPFNTYVKTCLWNFKNRVGSDNTAKKKHHLERNLGALNEDAVGIQFEMLSYLAPIHNSSQKGVFLKTSRRSGDGDGFGWDLMQYENKASSMDLSLYFKEISPNFTNGEKKIINVILSNPGKALTKFGKINVSAISRELKLNNYETNYLLESISSKINFSIL